MADPSSSSSSSSAVTCTYASSPAFLTSPEWANVRTALRTAHLPLRNLHWKPASRPSVRTIQKVDVDLVPLDVGTLTARASTDTVAGGGGGSSSRPASARYSSSGVEAGGDVKSMVPRSLLDKPVLNLYFVVCDDNDTYKLTTRAQLKAWHSLVANRKGQEWLIVHVVKADLARGAGGGAGRFFGVGGSVIDKVRSDFNLGKRDRCVQLSRPTFPVPDDPALWTDLTSKLKDGILSAFDARVAQREDESKTMEAMRTLPGWNFCTFFLLKESLAHSFEGMGLFEDALMQYNELEASFFQVLKEGNLKFFNLLFPTPLTNEDSLSVLSPTAKPYHDLILANRVSMFDFRIYVFARQGRLLGKLGRKAEGMRKGAEFVRGFGRWLEENTAQLPPNFVGSWIFCACITIVDTVGGWPSVTADEAATERAITATMAELFAMARLQLDKIGLQSGHLPLSYPFNALQLAASSTLALPAAASGEAAKPSITRRDLLAAVSSQEAFDVLFYELTQKAIEGFSQTGKERCTLVLIGSLGTVDFHRKRFDSAYARFASLAARYSSYNWTSLEAFYLIKTLQTHALLAKARDADWIAKVLALLKCLVRVGAGAEASVWEGEQGGLEPFVEGLVKDLRETGKSLDKETSTHGHVAFAIKVQTKSAIRPSPEDGDGCKLQVKVTNNLTCDVTADDVRACLSGKDIEQLWFTSGQVVLKPGDNLVDIFCPMPVSGLWTVESTQVRFSRVAFHYLWIPSRISDADDRVLVRIPRDPLSVDANVVLPLDLRLDSQPTVHLQFRTGRNVVTKAVVSLRVPDDELLLGLRDARLVSGEIKSLQASQDSMTLEGIAPDTLVVLSVPYRGTPRGASVAVRISVDYWTEKRANLKRALRKAAPLVLALPLSVNVQDIFRDSCLISRFTVSSDGRHHIRMASATLSGAQETLDIQPCRSESSPIINISPNSSASCLFRMTEKEKSHQQHETLRLTIKYRTLAEELRHLLTDVVRPILVARGVPALEPWFVDTLFARVDGGAGAGPGWSATFFARGTVDVPDVELGDVRRWSESLALDEPAFRTVVEAWEEAIEALDGLVAPTDGPSDLHWRTLQIPVDVPLRQVISAVRFAISTPGQVSVGQPLSCTMSIDCSSRWAGGGKSALDGVWMGYELGADAGDWLVSGRKKGSFLVSEGKPHTTTFTLIGLHAGLLVLPHVVLAPLAPHAHLSSETYLVNAAELVDVLPVSGRATFVVGTVGGGGGGGPGQAMPPPSAAPGGRMDGAGQRRFTELEV